MQGSKTPPDVRRRIAKLAAQGWSNSDIATDTQVCLATARRYADQARAEVKMRAMLTEELEGLRAVLAGIFRGRCNNCRGAIIAFRSQGYSSCPRCQKSFNPAAPPPRLPANNAAALPRPKR